MSEREALDIWRRICCSASSSRYLVDADAEAIIAAALDARTEACCRAVCWYCAKEARRGGDWHDGMRCAAAPIRAAFSKEALPAPAEPSDTANYAQEDHMMAHCRHGYTLCVDCGAPTGPGRWPSDGPSDERP